MRPTTICTSRGPPSAPASRARSRGVEEVLLAERPDRVLVLGDTDGGLGATLVAKRLGIRIFHMEAGNRCFDDRVPEEVNRRIIDHASDVLLPYTQGSRRNLLDEGILSERIWVTGNPIREVIERHQRRDRRGCSGGARRGSDVEPGGYLLMTAHRQETVDIEPRLRSLLSGVIAAAAASDLPIVASVHPRTRSRLEAFRSSVRRSPIAWGHHLRVLRVRGA